MEGISHRVVAHVVAAVLSYLGDALLVGSNAYNIVENIKMHGDLDFVTTNRAVVLSMPHKTRPGVSADVHIATLCIGGIPVDISTLDGLDLEEDMVNRSCVTSAIKISFDERLQIIRHASTRRIIPESVEAQVWVRRMVRAKGKRLARFWQKKLCSGFVWGEIF
tara:strand:+ start:62 stop:553 length:492 start_codon:yes stop_codon:yes gene_type:complete